MRLWRASTEAMALIKPLVNSWDVFDTLLTRFVLDPMQVFALIDRRHQGLDFAKRRLDAQAALDRIGKPYVIYDIYRQMVEQGLSPETASALLREELATERAMLLPVRGTVQQVAPEDLLISDMYLPGEIIAGWLGEICDLHGALPVIRSNWDKHSGTIWPKILGAYVIRTHYGDNANSDDAVPRKFGINTVLLRDIDLTDWEKTVAQLGLGQLALIQRETRLRSLRHDAGIYEKLAAGPYLGLLLGYANWLAAEFGEGAAFGFLSRDCDDLGRIFQAAFPSIRCFNIDLSRRLTRDTGNDGFFNEALPENCVLVDGVSTGRSVKALVARIGRSDLAFNTLFFLDHLLSAEVIAESSARWIFRSSDFGSRHYPLELLLQSPYPPVAGVAADSASGGIVKNFGRAEHSAPEARIIRGKGEIVTNFLRAIRLRGLPVLTDVQSQALMQAGLKAILESDLEPNVFPSFMAREIFAPFYTNRRGL
jgi:hypothetical protein